MGKENETQYGGEITIQNNWDVKESLMLYFFHKAAVHTFSSSCEVFVIFSMRHRASCFIYGQGLKDLKKKPDHILSTTKFLSFLQ